MHLTAKDMVIDHHGIVTDCPARHGPGRARVRGIVGRNLAYCSVSKTRSRNSYCTRTRIAAVAATVVSALLLFHFLGPANSPSDSKAVMAGNGPKIVSGHVYDSLLNPVPGADVTVMIKYDSTVRKTLTTSTDLSGFYTVTFGSASDWNEGETIQVDVTYDSLSATNSTIANLNPSQIVDVHFTEVIPEFGGLLVIVVLILPLLVAFVHRYRGKTRP